MTTREQKPLPENRRRWTHSSFSALEEQEEPGGGLGLGAPVRRRRGFSALEEQEEPGDRKSEKEVSCSLPGGLPEALDRYKAVVLLGEPGAGKTTALSHLAGKMADAADRLPVLVTLRYYEQDEKVEPFICRTWALALQEDLVAAIRAGRRK